jgi:predicted enzyme related to lactoylglutathione lyase
MNLNQITLPSSNVQASVDFYVAMGFELIVMSPPQYARFACPTGTSTFSVHLVDKFVENSGVTIYFECEDVDAQYARLCKLGFRFTSPPTDQPWLWREARLRDPDGNEICLFYAGANRLNPPWRVTAHHSESEGSVS